MLDIVVYSLMALTVLFAEFRGSSSQLHELQATTSKVECYNCSPYYLGFQFPKCLYKGDTCDPGQKCSIMYQYSGNKTTPVVGCSESCYASDWNSNQDCVYGGGKLSNGACYICCPDSKCVQDFMNALTYDFAVSDSVFCPGSCPPDDLKSCMTTGSNCGSSEFCYVYFDFSVKRIMGSCQDKSMIQSCQQRPDTSTCSYSVFEASEYLRNPSQSHGRCHWGCCDSNTCVSHIFHHFPATDFLESLSTTTTSTTMSTTTTSTTSTAPSTTSTTSNAPSTTTSTTSNAPSTTTSTTSTAPSTTKTTTTTLPTSTSTLAATTLFSSMTSFATTFSSASSSQLPTSSSSSSSSSFFTTVTPTPAPTVTTTDDGRLHLSNKTLDRFLNDCRDMLEQSACTFLKDTGDVCHNKVLLTLCPDTCGICQTISHINCHDTVINNGCADLAKNTDLCSDPAAIYTCPKTCGQCGIIAQNIVNDIYTGKVTVAFVAPATASPTTPLSLDCGILTALDCSILLPLCTATSTKDYCPVECGKC